VGPVETTANSVRELAQPFINHWGPFSMTRDAVSETAIRRFCEVAEDGNPVYWDKEFAERTRFGRVIAPPQSLFSMTFAPWWTPDFLKKKSSDETAALDTVENTEKSVSGVIRVYGICDDHGFTVNTVASQEVEYIAPFGPGDGRLKMRSMITEVSEEKQVRVGRGVFVTSTTEYRTETGNRLIGRSILVLLRYNADGSTNK